MIVNVKGLVDAENSGQTHFATWRKNPTQTTGAGIWFDLSMSPGNPLPNYYAATPLYAKAFSQTVNGGLSHGQNPPAGMTKYMKMMMAMTPTAAAAPLAMIMCDYLLCYPFVDMSVTDEQFMFNYPTAGADALPRYTDGVGVQIMAVEVAGQLGSGNPQFTVSYTNQAGVSGRTTSMAACNTQVVNGTIINSQRVQIAGKMGACGPFLTLQRGDTGVRKIDSITFTSADIGLVALVLVQQIDNIRIRTIDAPAERVPATDFIDMPVVANDAYLNFICCPAGTLAAAQIHGYIQTLWG